MPRRRTRAEKQVSDRRKVPDWVWGAGFGGIIMVFVGAFFALGQLGGGGAADPCGSSLPLLSPTGAEVDAKAFADEDAALGHMIDFLDQGDLNAANALFLGPVHNFTHNVDPPIRAKNEAAAKSLCNAVLKLENVLITGQAKATTQQLAADTTDLRNALRNGAEVLGFPRPTG